MADKPVKVEIIGDSSKYKKALGEAEDATGKFGKVTEGAGNALKAAFVGGAAVAGIHAVIDAASDYNETVSKSKVIFGEAADGAIDFAEGAAESFGLSQQAALDAEATFATFGKSAGLAGDALGGFSKDLTGLAADMASFSNTSPEQAIEAIGAALRGESEPIRAYGVLLDDATLRQTALKMGIYDGNGALTAQQKVLAAQKAIFEQTSDAQGDFARTSDGLAGQQKILSAEFENLKVSLGQHLIPVAVKTISTILSVGDAFGSLAFGVDLSTDAFREFFEEADKHTIKSIGDELHAMAKAADESHSFFSRLSSDLFDSRWDGINETFKKMGEESPAALRAVIDEMRELQTAAENGDPAARKLVKDYEITTEHLDKLFDAYLAVSPEMAETTRETNRLSAGSSVLSDALEDVGDDIDETTESVTAFDQSLIDVEFAYDRLTGKLDEQDAWQHVQESIMEFAANTEATAQDVRNLTRDLADYINETTLIPAEKKTLFLAELDEGKLEEIQRRLEIWARNNQINVNLIARGAPGFDGGLSGRRAGGGPVEAGRLYMVGENGEELFVPDEDGKIINAQQTGQIRRGSRPARGLPVSMPSQAPGGSVGARAPDDSTGGRSPADVLADSPAGLLSGGSAGGELSASEDDSFGRSVAPRVELVADHIASELSSSFGGVGDNITITGPITINMPTGSSPDDMMKTLATYVKRNGTSQLQKLVGMGT